MKTAKMVRLPNLKRNHFQIKKSVYIWKVLVKSFQMMLHDTQNELYQKLLRTDFFPGRYSIRNILRPENANRQKKCFFKPTFSRLSTLKSWKQPESVLFTEIWRYIKRAFIEIANCFSFQNTVNGCVLK